MRWLRLSVLVCAVWSTTSTEVLETTDAAQREAGENAIYVAESSATTSTSFTLEHTRIVITRETDAKASASGPSSLRPRLVVIDAAAKGLVCLPTSTLKEINLSQYTSGNSTSGSSSPSGSAAAAAGGGSAAAAAAVGSAAAAAASGGSGTTGHEADKSVHVSVGQGKGITATAAASGGGAAAAAGGSGSAAAAAAGDSSAAAAAGHSGSGSASTAVEGAGDVHQSAAVDQQDTKLSGDLTTDYQIYDPYACECVPKYLCDDQGYIVTYGEGLIDIRLNAKRNVSQIDSSHCQATEECCRHRDDERVAISWSPERCGEHSPARLDARIVEGQAAGLGQYPWMAALLRQEGDNMIYMCGASLIRPDVVLTAAHCVNEWHESGQLVVRVGEWDTNNADQVYPHQDVPVSQVVYHQQFNGKSLFNDVALLKLSLPVELAQHINTICLPTAQTHPNIDFNNCVATGWGKESFGNSQYSSILKELQLAVVDSGTCQGLMRETRLGGYFKLHDSFLCAGGLPDVDTCTGDGGSPLVCRDASVQDREVYVQIGIVAWGIGCGRGGLPGVYADVAKMSAWINDNLATLGSVNTEYGY